MLSGNIVLGGGGIEQFQYYDTGKTDYIDRRII
jgi:hypothetical protein